MAEPPLTPARWRAMEEILLAIWDAPPGERYSLLNERCAGDTALLVEFRAMLAAEEAATAWLGGKPGQPPGLEVYAGFQSVQRPPRLQ
jgi:hypothetical protein